MDIVEYVDKGHDDLMDILWATGILHNLVLCHCGTYVNLYDVYGDRICLAVLEHLDPSTEDLPCVSSNRTVRWHPDGGGDYEMFIHEAREKRAISTLKPPTQEI